MDTICAIATPYGESSISIIRISGNDAISIVNKIFSRDLNKFKSHTINYGHIKDENNNIIDEVLISVFKKPKSYTAEDVVEINSHGGIYSTNRILKLLLDNNARLAEPGEFTKRAFLNGRIDLTKAEAVMDIINSKNEKALILANKNLRGQVFNLIKELQKEILGLIAHIEVNIDYPEYEDIEEMNNVILKPKVFDVINKINNIIEKSKIGRIIQEGVKTVILGKPNVGKSSLLNYLLDENKAIVTDIAGTTRDLIEGYLNIGGITLKLIDTAGIHDTKDLVESIGITKTKESLKEADLVILVLDSTNINKEDYDLLELTKDKVRIILLNKIDLNNQIEFEDSIKVSILKEQNLDFLEKEIIKKVGLHNLNYKDLTYLSNIRHINKLEQALKHLKDALDSIDINNTVDIVEIDLKNAWTRLGEILGNISTDSLLDELFANFCLGK